MRNPGDGTGSLPLEHSDLEDWRSLFETNVLGVVGITKAAIPTLRANPPAVVILACVPSYSAYRATKAPVSVFCPVSASSWRLPASGWWRCSRACRHRHVPAEHRGPGLLPPRPLSGDG